jgi:hypothetical protein
MLACAHVLPFQRARSHLRHQILRLLKMLYLTGRLDAWPAGEAGQSTAARRVPHEPADQ